MIDRRPCRTRRSLLGFNLPCRRQLPAHSDKE
jgi:hypothetical protein